VVACDHDFAPEAALKLFGVLLPASNDVWFYFTDSVVTADFIVDRLEGLWPELRRRFRPHTLVLNMDNGPETQSRRTQLIKRLVDFARTEYVNLELAYYPPYHSKYNAIERVWGVLENHWRGELLDSRQKVLDLALDMTWNGHHPVVTFIHTSYQTGIKQSKKVMAAYERTICRMPGLEPWFVWIPLMNLPEARYC
jgi:transposase